jgi:hypothetical protein
MASRIVPINQRRNWSPAEKVAESNQHIREALHIIYFHQHFHQRTERSTSHYKTSHQIRPAAGGVRISGEMGYDWCHSSENNCLLLAIFSSEARFVKMMKSSNPISATHLGNYLSAVGFCQFTYGFLAQRLWEV